MVRRGRRFESVRASRKAHLGSPARDSESAPQLHSTLPQSRSQGTFDSRRHGPGANASPRGPSVHRAEAKVASTRARRELGKRHSWASTNLIRTDRNDGRHPALPNVSRDDAFVALRSLPHVSSLGASHNRELASRAPGRRNAHSIHSGRMLQSVDRRCFKDVVHRCFYASYCPPVRIRSSGAPSSSAVARRSCTSG